MSEKKREEGIVESEEAPLATKGLSRRGFLKAAGLMGLGAAATTVAGCAPEAPTASGTLSQTGEAAGAASSVGVTGGGSALDYGGLNGLETLADAGIGNNFATYVQTDGSVAGVATFAGGRRRPEPHTGHPSPMMTGHVGPDAVPIQPVEAPSSWDMEADIVAVGAGYGGLTAAAYAAQNGYRAVLCEKNGETGGASAHSAFNVSIVGGTKLQIQAGYFWPTDTFDIVEIVNRLNNSYNDSCDLELLRATATASPVWFDWMVDEEKADWIAVTSRFGTAPVINGETTSILGNKYATDLLEQNARDAGAEVLLNCEVENLVVGDGRVIGVKAKLIQENREVFIKAEKGVILTAGHFGMNLDLLEQYCPSAYMQCAAGGPMPFTTGECFRMGLGVGADVSGFNSWSGWDGAADEYWGSGSGNYFNYFWSGERQLAKQPWLLVGKACNRLPYYVASGSTVEPGQEFHPGFDIRSQSMGDLTDCAAWNASIGNRNYCIFDDDYQTNVWKFKSAHTASDKGRIPVHPESGLTDETYVTCDWVGEFEAAIARGAAFKADTLEELAEKVGLDPQKLVAKVDEWNEIVASGDDSQFTPQYFPDWLVPIQKPPYYCIPNSTQIGKIMCGLRVNKTMQVLRPDATVIDGLYAGFFTAGGTCGESDYGGQFGNPTLAGGAAISGIGGLMAVRGALGNPVTEDDWCDEAKALNAAAAEKRSKTYLQQAADGSYMKDKVVPPMVLAGEQAGSHRVTDGVGEDPAGPYTDGSYTGTGKGVGGDINVTLEISGDAIKVSDISPNNETPGIGGYEAIEDGTYIKLIEDAQGSGFDVISGATKTSDAIKKAVQDALKQAAN